MPADLFANNASTTLAAGITSSATSLTVASSTGFPVPTTGASLFRVLIGTEILTVTAVSGTTWTVTRGEESTTAVAHTSGDVVTMVVTQGALGNLGSGGGDYYRSGYYYAGRTVTGTSTLAVVSPRLYFAPFLVPARRTFDRIGIDVSTAATASSGGTLSFGIYNTIDGSPGSLITSTSTISSETTGAKEMTISQTLDPGLHWLAMLCLTSGCTVRTASAAADPWVSASTAPMSSTSNLAPYLASTSSFTSPVSPGSFFRAATFPLICLRAA